MLGMVCMRHRGYIDRLALGRVLENLKNLRRGDKGRHVRNMRIQGVFGKNTVKYDNQMVLKGLCVLRGAQGVGGAPPVGDKCLGSSWFTWREDLQILVAPSSTYDDVRSL